MHIPGRLHAFYKYVHVCLSAYHCEFLSRSYTLSTHTRTERISAADALQGFWLTPAAEGAPTHAAAPVAVLFIVVSIATSSRGTRRYAYIWCSLIRYQVW